MRLLSVNVARPRPHTVPTNALPTGIFKVPRPGPVFVSRLGLEGDFVGNSQHHGGPDQAMYVYSASDYDAWMQQLQEALEPGTFGENLTFSDFGDADVRIGDRYRVGNVLLEVTCPRIPCDTLAGRMNDLGFVKKFRQERRPGFYARVLVEGHVEAGMPVERVPAPQAWPTITETFDLWFEKAPREEDVRRLLASPLAQRGREAYERLLSERA